MTIPVLISAPRRPTPVALPGRASSLASVGAGVAATTYVHPGQAVVMRGPGVMSTILGSCVTVCLHDAEAGIGGMNHYLLPTAGAEVSEPGRYGLTAIEELINRMLAWGARRSHITAQIYGGASVLNAFAGENHLGLRNAAIARQVLSAHGIKITAADIGGLRGRKVAFDPATGVAQVHVIGQMVGR